MITTYDTIGWPLGKLKDLRNSKKKVLINKNFNL